MTTVKAQLNTLRIAPRKVRLVADLIKGKPVAKALDQLDHLAKRSATPMKKLVRSAVANASAKQLDAEHLVIKDLQVDEGVKLKRFQPKGFGRVNPIHKKTSKIRLILEHRAPKTPAQPKPEQPVTQTK